MKLVIVESPFAASTKDELARNVKYARACLADCLKRGEAPFASHLLYTQPGVLDDRIPAERTQGIEAGLAWGRLADLTAIYTDLGLTAGMIRGIERAEAQGRPMEHRRIPGWIEANVSLPY